MSEKRRFPAKKVLKMASGALITLVFGAIAGVLILTRTGAGQGFLMESRYTDRS